MNFGNIIRGLFFKKKTRTIVVPNPGENVVSWSPDREGTVLVLDFGSNLDRYVTLDMSYASGSPDDGDELEVICLRDTYNNFPQRASQYYEVRTWEGGFNNDVEYQRIWHGQDAEHRIYRYGAWDGGGNSWQSRNARGLDYVDKARAILSNPRIIRGSATGTSDAPAQLRSHGVTLGGNGALLAFGFRNDTGASHLWSSSDNGFYNNITISGTITDRRFVNGRWFGTVFYMPNHGTGGNFSVDRVGLVGFDGIFDSYRDFDISSFDVSAGPVGDNSTHNYVATSTDEYIYEYSFSGSYERIADVSARGVVQSLAADPANNNVYVTYTNSAEVTQIETTGYVQSAWQTLLSNTTVWDMEGRYGHILVAGNRTTTAIHCQGWTAAGQQVQLQWTRSPDVGNSTSTVISHIEATREGNYVALVIPGGSDGFLRVAFSSDFGETWNYIGPEISSGLNVAPSTRSLTSRPKFFNTFTGDALVYVTPSSNGAAWEVTDAWRAPSVYVFGTQGL